MVATHLGERLGGSFIVENRAGAGGNIGAGAVAHADPDGYTLLLTTSALVVNPGLYKRVPYDPYKDFAPIAELVAKAQADPASLAYASAGIGTTPHLSGELLKVDAGIKMTHVPFSGAGPAIQAILSSTTPVACVSLPPALPQIGSGALKALAITGATRWFDLPEVPTMVELGYKDFLTDIFQGFLAPAQTPAEIVELLARAALDILHDPAVSGQLRNNGFEVLANGPDGMRKRIADEVPKWRALVAKAGIVPV